MPFTNTVLLEQGFSLHRLNCPESIKQVLDSSTVQQDLAPRLWGLWIPWPAPAPGARFPLLWNMISLCPEIVFPVNTWKGLSNGGQLQVNFKLLTWIYDSPAPAGFMRKTTPVFASLNLSVWWPCLWTCILEIQSSGRVRLSSKVMLRVEERSQTPSSPGNRKRKSMWHQSEV